MQKHQTQIQTHPKQSHILARDSEWCACLGRLDGATLGAARWARVVLGRVGLRCAAGEPGVVLVPGAVKLPCNTRELCCEYSGEFAVNMMVIFQ